MTHSQQVAVVGVTGYTGFELARLLLRHPEVRNPVFYVRETNGAKCLAELFPQLRGLGEAPLRQLSVDAITQSNAGTALLWVMASTESWRRGAWPNCFRSFADWARRPCASFLSTPLPKAMQALRCFG